MSQSSRHNPQGPLARWARFAARNPWKVISGWVVLIALIAVLSNTVGASFQSAFTLPGSESQTAIQLLEEKFPEAAGDTATLVFQARDGSLTDPAVQSEIEAIIAEAGGLPHVGGVITPEMNPLQTSADGTIS